MTAPKEIQLQIEVPEGVTDGKYSNLAIINHTETEFTFDFIFVQPQQPRAKVGARVVMAPKHARRLLGALQDNLQKYEAVHGPIRL